jgi:histo-blood group ABO system transferase
MKKVGMLVIATNKYIQFLQPLISSADNFFLKDQEVTYFIFTNQDIEIETNRSVVRIGVDHKEWPWMTLGRYRIFSNNSSELSKMDYLYYCDADMRFVGDIGDEILSDLVTTQHCGYYNQRGTPETNNISTACVFGHEQMQYFAGGFNGGSSKEYLKMSNDLSNNIDIDYSKGIIAVWHDESHLNRYMIDNKPSLILDPGYCFHEGSNRPFRQRLIALSKNHSEIRK